MALQRNCAGHPRSPPFYVSIPHLFIYLPYMFLNTFLGNNIVNIDIDLSSFPDFWPASTVVGIFNGSVALQLFLQLYFTLLFTQNILPLYFELTLELSYFPIVRFHWLGWAEDWHFCCGIWESRALTKKNSFFIFKLNFVLLNCIKYYNNF